MLDNDDPFKQLADAVFQTQGTGLAVYHILLELTLRVVRSQPDPSGLLKSMFEAISAKLDVNSFESQKKTASAWERETISTFFSVAEKAVRRGTQGQAGRKPRPK
jgi:hypothetical protein